MGTPEELGVEQALKDRLDAALAFQGRVHGEVSAAAGCGHELLASH